MTDARVAFGFHIQDTQTFCGPAVVMMEIDTTGSGRDLPTQKALNAKMFPCNVGDFDTSPEAMVCGLNSFVSSQIGTPFVTNPSGETAGTAFARIVQALTGSPPVAPVATTLAGSHWVMIVHVNTTGVVQPGATYGVDCLFINSPIESTRKIQHERGDVCQTIGLPNTSVSYKSWLASWHVTDHGFVTITPAGTTPLGTVRDPLDRRFDTARPIEEVAAGILEAAQLRTNGPLAPAMARADGFGAPMVVDRWDQKGEIYQLVPLLHRGEPVGMVAIERDHDRWTAFARETPIRILTRAQAQELLDFHAVIATRLVWQPSTAGIFPTQPFYHATSGDREKFIRIDGTMFDALTPIRYRG